jgi:hypothetical protein
MAMILGRHYNKHNINGLLASPHAGRRRQPGVSSGHARPL